MNRGLRLNALYLIDLSPIEDCLSEDEPRYLYATLRDYWEEDRAYYHFHVHAEDSDLVVTEEDLLEVNIVPSSAIERWLKDHFHRIDVLALLEARERFIESATWLLPNHTTPQTA